jgi:hypothetical protein
MCSPSRTASVPTITSIRKGTRSVVLSGVDRSRICLLKAACGYACDRRSGLRNEKPEGDGPRGCARSGGHRSHITSRALCHRPMTMSEPPSRFYVCSRTELLTRRCAMSSKLLVLFIVAPVAVAGCGSSSKPAANDTPAQPVDKPVVAVQTARALNAPFAYRVAGNVVTVAIDRAQRFPSSTDEPVQVTCANLGANGFVDQNQGQGVWKQGAGSTTVTLPKAATGLDLCAVNFSARAGKQAIGFFSAQAKAKYLADQKTTG